MFYLPGFVEGLVSEGVLITTLLGSVGSGPIYKENRMPINCKSIMYV